MRFLIMGKGRMGALFAETARAAGHEIAAAFDEGDGASLATWEGRADAAVDFSRPGALEYLEPYVCRTGTPLLSGTTGYSQGEMERLRALGGAAPVLWSANYSLGIAALRRAAGLMREVLGPEFDVEITELHHRRKADSPSGTAKLLASAVDPALTPVYGREGMAGPRPREEIGVHALRGGTAAGTHTVWFLGPDEELELTHRAASPRIFVYGALHMARLLPGLPRGLYTIDDLLFGGGEG